MTPVERLLALADDQGTQIDNEIVDAFLRSINPLLAEVPPEQDWRRQLVAEVGATMFFAGMSAGTQFALSLQESLREAIESLKEGGQ